MRHEKLSSGLALALPQRGSALGRRQASTPTSGLVLPPHSYLRPDPRLDGLMRPNTAHSLSAPTSTTSTRLLDVSQSVATAICNRCLQCGFRYGSILPLRSLSEKWRNGSRQGSGAYSAVANWLIV